MLIQWCLKGVREIQGKFDDAEAKNLLSGPGLSSSWLYDQQAQNTDIFEFPDRSHFALSRNALIAHVNGYSTIAMTTPYISLSGGCRELDPFLLTVTTYNAWQTALQFATAEGTQSGFVYCLWVLVSPKPAPELPGFGEEVRELNLFSEFAQFHHEGEIAAKLYVPARQIQYVAKYRANLTREWRAINADFVPPDRISNVLDFL